MNTNRQKRNQPEKFPGIPSEITLKGLEAWVGDRVSKKRMEHIRGVVTVGREIAQGLGVATFPVELACWLHDACKEVKNKVLIEVARSKGRRLSPEEEEHGHILHGPVAAILAQEELGITNSDVLNAIAEHTIGSLNMSVTSKIVYLADKLEASRPEDLTRPIWEALNATPIEGPANACHSFDESGIEDLDRAMLVSITLITKNLLKKGKPVQPKSMQIRNHFLRIVGGQQ